VVGNHVLEDQPVSTVTVVLKVVECSDGATAVCKIGLALRCLCNNFEQTAVELAKSQAFCSLDALSF